MKLTYEELETQRNHYQDLLQSVVSNLDLYGCKKCGHYSMRGHVCYECRYDHTAEEAE